MIDLNGISSSGALSAYGATTALFGDNFISQLKPFRRAVKIIVRRVLHAPLNGFKIIEQAELQHRIAPRFEAICIYSERIAVSNKPGSFRKRPQVSADVTCNPLVSPATIRNHSLRDALSQKNHSGASA